MTQPLVDQAERKRICTDFDHNLVVEAAAGTGKTTALTSRLVALLECGRTQLPRLVALTFTEKAAGEMKLRLRSALEARRIELATDSPEHARLEAALGALETAQVGTIHGFCGDLLRERPVQAGIDPAFSVCAAEQEQQLLDQVFDRWFQGCLAQPPEGVRRVLRRHKARGSIVDDLRQAAAGLVQQRDFPGAFGRPALDRCGRIDAAMAELRAIAPLAQRGANPRDPLTRCLQEVQTFLSTQEVLADTLGTCDYDALEAGLCNLQRSRQWRGKGYGTFYGKELPRQDVLRVRDQVYGVLTTTVHALEADLAAALQQDLQVFVQAYEAEKQQQGSLDFLDMLLCTRNLLRDQAEVRHELQDRYTHLFLDEFQDVDPLQAEIVAALCCDSPSLRFGAPDGPQVPAGKLFVVGDPKQAIYRFRRADVHLYERIKRALANDGAAVLQLTTSFRGRPGIQAAINAGFAVHMQGTADGVQAHYQPLHAHRSEGTGPSVIALPIPATVGQRGYVAGAQISASAADAVGALVERLCNSGTFTVEEGGQEVALAPRHICLLLRRFRSFGKEATEPYVQALASRRIPHVLVGGRALHGREEMQALRTALLAIEWPQDPLLVYAALKGPLFMLRDGDLLAFRQSVGPLDPLATASTSLSGPLQEVQEALSLLGALHSERNQRASSETLWALLSATRAHAGFAMWQDGEQVLANLTRLGELARRFEAGGATSFRAFCTWLEQNAERGDQRDTTVVEEGSEGVRIMTAHNAKGLEFPVVVLCDPTVPRSGGWPSRYLDPARGLWATSLCGCQPHELRVHAEAIAAEDEAEEVRIAYVAATRARDLLVVPVGSETPLTGWLDVLQPGLQPPANMLKPQAAPPEVRAAANADAPTGPLQGERPPGFYPAQQGSHHVLHWDLRNLALDTPPRGGLRHQGLLVDDAHGHGERGLAAFEQWQTRRQNALQQGAPPQYAAVSVTARAAALQTPPDTSPEVLQLPVDRSARPGGARFGSLVHLTLADSEFRNDPRWIDQLCQLHGRQLGATPTETAAASTAVQNALAHPLLQEAADSPSARFEVPFTQCLDDGQLLEGVIDLLFQRGDGWVVVDFKTDTPSQQAQYRAQIGLYAAAIEQLTGQPASAILLGI